MKAKLDYKSKKIITLAITILVLLAVAVFGVTIFLKSDDTSSAIGEETNQSENKDKDKNFDEKLPVAGEEDNTNTANADTQANERTVTNNTSAASDVQNSAINSNNITDTDGNTTTEAIGEVPNNEYVVERKESQERKVKEDFLVGWTPMELSALAVNLNADIPELEANKRAITKTGTNAVSTGEEVTYEIIVKNNSEKDLKNINISDNIPEGTEFVETDNEGIVNGQKILWKKDMAKKSEIKVSFKVKVVKIEGTIKNIAVVNGKNTNETENPIIKYSKTSEILRDKEVVPSPAKPGDRITYRVSVTNTSETQKTSAVIKDDIPEQTVLEGDIKIGNDVYTLEQLKSGINVVLNEFENKILEFIVVVKEEAKGQIKNTAIVSGNETNPSDNDLVNIKGIKTAEPSENVKQGDTITYNIIVTNTGNVLGNIDVTDQIPEQLEYIDGSINKKGKIEENVAVWRNIEVIPGEELVLSFKAKVKDSVIGTVKNVAIVDGKPTPEVKNPIITFEKKVTQEGKVKAGDTLTYTVKVRNTGEVSAKNVEVKDKAPEGTTYIKANNGGVKATNGEITWKIEEIKAGEEQEVSFEVKVNDINDKDKIKNKATVDGKETNETENEYVKPIITRAKTSNKETVKAGDEITYTITATNAGGLEKEVEIKDKVPANTTFVKADNGGVEANGEIIWKVKAPAYGKVEVTFTVKVNEGATGTIANKAKIDGASTPEVKNPIITFEKKVTQEGKVKAGDTLTYTVKVRNTGEVSAKNVEVKDKAPEGTTYIKANNGGVKATNGEITWKIEEIKAGEEQEVSFEVKVNDINDKDKIKNKATVDGKETNETENEYVEPIIEGKKASNPISGTLVKENQNITYTITATNAGGLEKEVEIKDKVPVNTTLISVDNDGIEANGEVKWKVNVPAYGDAKVNFTVKVTMTEQLNYAITNIATVDGKDTNQTLHEVKKPQIDVRKSATINETGKYQEKIHENDIINYTITLINKGFLSTEENVIIKDKVPVNTTLISVDNGGVEANGEIIWNVGKLNIGESKSVTFKVKANKIENGTIAEITNVATANGKTSNIVYNKVVKDNVQLEKVNTPKGDVKEGDKIDYTITLTNKNGGEAKTVTLKDTVPVGTTLVENSITLDDKKISESTMNSQEITVEPNEKYELKFTVTVNKLEDGMYNKTITNTAVMVKDGVETSKAVSNTVKKANITMKKSVDKSEREVGKDLKYTIELTNKGELDGTVIVKDTVPTGTTLKGNIVLTDKTGTRNIESSALANGVEVTVEANKTARIEFTVTVNSNQYGKTIVNTAVMKKSSDDEEKTDTVKTKILEKNIKVTEISNQIRATNFVLVIDVSSSMTYLDGNDETRIEAAKKAAIKFVNDIYAKDDTSTFTVVVFAKKSYTKTITFKNTDDKTVSTATKKDQTQLVNAINNLETDRGTNIYSGLVEAKNAIYSENGIAKTYPNNSNVMIVLGDGEPYGGDDNNKESGIIAEAGRIKATGTNIYSIGFGAEAAKENSKAWRILKGISSNDKIYTSVSATELVEKFKEISKDLDKSKNIKTVNGVANITVNGNLKIDSNHKLKINNGTTIIKEYSSKAEIESDPINHLTIDSKGNIVWSIKDCSNYVEYDNLAIEYYLDD